MFNFKVFNRYRSKSKKEMLKNYRDDQVKVASGGTVHFNYKTNKKFSTQHREAARQFFEEYKA